MATFDPLGGRNMDVSPQTVILPNSTIAAKENCLIKVNFIPTVPSFFAEVVGNL